MGSWFIVDTDYKSTRKMEKLLQQIKNTINLNMNKHYFNGMIIDVAEIPFFSKQFFAPSVGPDNAFKIHVDATHTAHTYNPSPVGRRFIDTEPADREAHSAYSIALAKREYVNSTFITEYRRVSNTDKRLYVNDPNVFPESHTDVDEYKGFTNHVYRYRKVWLANGKWAFYTNAPATDKYLALADDDMTYGHSEGFFED